MAKHSKKYQDALKAAPKAAVSLEEAVAFIKAHPGAKFDETVDVGLRLGATAPVSTSASSSSPPANRPTPPRPPAPMPPVSTIFSSASRAVGLTSMSPSPPPMP